MSLPNRKRNKAMDEKSKKRKGGSITEESVSTLLQRYSVKTVLNLLKEVAASDGQKIDWNEIVKNTTTGISSARECQMLWRHLAYGQTLIDQLDDAANPLDDDSDLEDEAEAFPVVSRETLVEAAACVKVLVASDYPIDSHVLNYFTVEAPLPINIPMFKVPSDSSLPANPMQGTNIIIPVSVPLSPPIVADKAEDGKSGVDVPPPKKRKGCPTKDNSKTKRPKDGNSGVDVPPPKKRKVWSTEDDLKLTAAVQKHGEQKWPNIAGGEFKNDRTPEELSTRWASIRKKKGNLNTGTTAEERKATSQAILLALEPKGNYMKAARQMSNVCTKTTQHESQITSAPSSYQQLGMAGPSKPQVLTERPPMNCTNSPTSMIKVAAFAAGARIATPADASFVSEAAARSQNVVHIRTGASSLTRPSTTTMPNQLCSNFSRNGPTNAPISAFASTVPNLQLGVAKEKQGSFIKPMELAVQSNPVGTAIILDGLSGNVNATASTPNKVVKTAEVAGKEPVQRGQVAGVDNIQLKAAVELISEDQSGSIVNQTQDLRIALTCLEVEDNGNCQYLTDGGTVANDASHCLLYDDYHDLHIMIGLPGKKHGDTITTGKEIHDPTSSKDKHVDLSCKRNGNGKGSAVNTITTTGAEANN